MLPFGEATGCGSEPTVPLDTSACGAAGEQRLLFLAAANRDPAAFPDPDRFDLRRDPNPQPQLLRRSHFCLGAPLARLHGQVALQVLFTRHPGLSITTPPAITASVSIRQVDRFIVQWQPNSQNRQI